MDFDPQHTVGTTHSGAGLQGIPNICPWVKATLAFQIGNCESIFRRKRPLMFNGSNSLAAIYKEIAGQLGERALWPREFGEMIQGGAVAFLYSQNVDETWCLPLPQTTLVEIAMQETDHDGRRSSLCAHLFLCLEGPAGTISDPDPRTVFSVSHCSVEAGTGVSSIILAGGALTVKNTFLHVKACLDNEIDPVGSYAESAPGWYCGPTSSFGQEADNEQHRQQEIHRASNFELAENDMIDVDEFSSITAHDESEQNTVNGRSSADGCFVAASFCDEEEANDAFALFHAVLKGNREKVSNILLSHSSASFMSRVDGRGSSVMHFWARSSATPADRTLLLGEMLIQAGADVNSRRETDGMTPLHHVATTHNRRKGWLAFHKALFLIRNGASLTATTTRGQTPLELLSTDGRVATARMASLLQPTAFSAVAVSGCQTEGCSWCYNRSYD